MKRQNARTLALLVSTFVYLLIGATMYHALESEFEKIERTRLSEEAKSFQKQYNITNKDFENMRINFLKSKSYQAGSQWNFTGSFFFAISVITTIGYGYSTPKTFGGKLFCIGYALLGIPLNIVMFQSIGERFNMGITIVLHRIKRCCHRKSVGINHTELTIVSGTLCSMVLLGGASAFWYYEGWSYFDAFYYCFITLSTIGFGDFVALQNDTMNALKLRPGYVAFSILYILFGLTVFAAALNLMVLKLLTMNTEDERKDKRDALAAANGTAFIDDNDGIIKKNVTSRRLASLIKEDPGISNGINGDSPVPAIKQEHITLDIPMITAQYDPNKFTLQCSKIKSSFAFTNAISLESSHNSMLDDDISTHSESLYSSTEYHLGHQFSRDKFQTSLKRGSV